MLHKCSKCGYDKPEDDFYTGHYSWCRACIKVYAANQRKVYRYGITLDQYNELFTKQGGRCAICETHQSELPDPLCIDHDHVTNQIRGLVCRTCNLGLGHFKDDPELLLKAVEYLGG